eukprot:TRINITY_DN2694_c0_g1_i40.p1 TRINITY_DN2694_c0_g1~~TRINITY_DN2694_c0_g1_i40.p1  ORF type:complete len:292 (+),score=28.25 TRINITY_DN2694_c0_g1_i40:111-986(+)
MHGARHHVRVLKALATACASSVPALAVCLAGCDSVSTPRRPASGVGWSEVFLSHEQAETAVDATQSVQRGHSILLFDKIASPDQCSALRGEVTKVADPENPTRVDFLTVTKDLSHAGQGAADSLLLQAVAYAIDHLPPLIPTLFGDSFRSHHSCIFNKQLKFSEDMPWVIVYGVGGEFMQHTDGQTLTILVNLSDPGSEEFTGGGTAFWSPGDLRKNGPTSQPSFVLAPGCGSAVLFAGSVIHAGLPVTRGRRTALVASFSLLDGASDADVSWKLLEPNLANQPTIPPQGP